MTTAQPIQYQIMRTETYKRATEEQRAELLTGASIVNKGWKNSTPEQIQIKESIITVAGKKQRSLSIIYDTSNEGKGAGNGTFGDAGDWVLNFGILGRDAKGEMSFTMRRIDKVQGHTISGIENKGTINITERQLIQGYDIDSIKPNWEAQWRPFTHTRPSAQVSTETLPVVGEQASQAPSLPSGLAGNIQAETGYDLTHLKPTQKDGIYQGTTADGQFFHTKVEQDPETDGITFTIYKAGGYKPDTVITIPNTRVNNWTLAQYDDGTLQGSRDYTGNKLQSCQSGIPVPIVKPVIPGKELPSDCALSDPSN